MKPKDTEEVEPSDDFVERFTACVDCDKRIDLFHAVGIQVRINGQRACYTWCKECAPQEVSLGLLACTRTLIGARMSR